MNIIKSQKAKNFVLAKQIVLTIHLEMYSNMVFKNHGWDFIDVVLTDLHLLFVNCKC